MKVLLCCILKLENRYLEEWITYYQKLGVDKIVIYDNNDIEGPYAEDIRKVKSVAKGIESNFIDVYPVPAPQPASLQNRVYNDCYERYGQDYDWIMRFDIDEFLVLEKFDNIHDFLSQEKFNDFDLIHLNWKIYDDNDIIKAPKKYNVMNTYTRELTDVLPSRFHLNDEMKSIIRGGLPSARCRNSHTIVEKVRSCNALGIEDNSFSFISKYPLHKGAWLNHYITKSLDEYINVKLLRQASGNGNVCNPARVNYQFFFLYNTYSEEKIKYLKKLVPDIDLNKLNKDILIKIENQKILIKQEQEKYCKEIILDNSENNKENEIYKKSLSFKNNNIMNLDNKVQKPLKKLIFR